MADGDNLALYTFRTVDGRTVADVYVDVQTPKSLADVTALGEKLAAETPGLFCGVATYRPWPEGAS